MAEGARLAGSPRRLGATVLAVAATACSAERCADCMIMDGSSATTADAHADASAPRCRSDDGANVALPPPRSPTTSADAGEAAILESLDMSCGDVWCEGDFEYWFHRYRCEPSGDRCLLQVRMYRSSAKSREVDAANEATYPTFTARFVHRESVRSCTPPCGRIGKPYEPCEVFDVECDVRPTRDAGYVARGTKETFDCVSAMTKVVEARFPRVRR